MKKTIKKRTPRLCIKVGKKVFRLSLKESFVKRHKINLDEMSSYTIGTVYLGLKIVELEERIKRLEGKR